MKHQPFSLASPQHFISRTPPTPPKLMSFEIQTMPTANKQTRYEHLIEDIATLISGEHREISVMANVAAAIRQAFSFFWVGFYVVDGDHLHLGPFQGDVACYRIRQGRGVCGTAWAKRQTLVVPDVDAFPGHIACSSSSRSEIVVPIMAGGEVKGVLDIDSCELNTFDETDKVHLEKIVSMLARQIYEGGESHP